MCAEISTRLYCYYQSQNIIPLPIGLKSVIIKVTVKFSLEQVIKAQRGSRGIALLFL